MKRHKLPSDWRQVPLSSVADVQTGLALGKKAKIDPVRCPYLRVANVQDGYLDLNEVKEVVVERTQVARYSLRPGDVLMTEGGDFDKLGRGYIWHDEIPNCLHQNHVFVVRPHSDLQSYFLASLTSSDYGRSYFQSCSKQSTNLASINSSQLKAFPVPLPGIKEQEAITAVLSTWDRGIGQLTDLIAAKLRFKQGLMQQLLTGHRQFPGYKEDWKHVRIGDVAHEISERNPDGDSIPVLSCTKYDGLVDSLKYFGKRVFSENTDNYKVVRRNDFAYATNHIEEGSIGLLRHADVGLVSPMYTVFRTSEDVNPEYLYRVLKTETLRQVFASFTSASVNRRGSLRWKQFSTISLELPSIAEQEKINELMASLDLEIELLRKQLLAFKQQKKGLMQKLLTGEVRAKEHSNG